MTSGLIVVAKNDRAHNSLCPQQIKSHTAGRTYVAIVEGNIKEDAGTMDAPIGRHPVDRKKMGRGAGWPGGGDPLESAGTLRQAIRSSKPGWKPGAPIRFRVAHGAP